MSETPILVFDGDCGICTASANWVRRRVPSVRVRSHTEHGVDSLDKVWLVEGGSRREGADAVSAVLRLADRAPWRVLGAVLALPVVRWIARGAYWVIARNRTRLSRLFGLKACALPVERSL